MKYGTPFCMKKFSMCLRVIDYYNPVCFFFQPIYSILFIAKDKTNAEISELLNISRRTVEHHVSSILRKLDVNSRVGAVVKAMKLRLIE
jgi:hypothetical protein